MHEAGYGYWGFSPSNTPEGGYSAYGVDGIGMNPDGYPSDEANTLVDDDVLRKSFTGPYMEEVLRPVIGQEQFGARP